MILTRIKQHEDQIALDQMPDAVRQLQKPKVAPKPLTKPLIDKQTMDEMKKRAEQAPAPPPPAQQQAQTPEQPKPQPTQPLPPNPQSQAPEAPRPQAVPAKPNFAMGPQNPADQLRQDMQHAMHGQGQQGYGNQPSVGSGLARHPGAGRRLRGPFRHAGRRFQLLAGALALHYADDLGSIDPR